MVWKAKEKKIEADTKKDTYCPAKLEDLFRWPLGHVTFLYEKSYYYPRFIHGELETDDVK